MIIVEELETVPVDLNVKYIAALSGVFGPLYGYTVETVVVEIVKDFLKAHPDLWDASAEVQHLSDKAPTEKDNG